MPEINRKKLYISPEIVVELELEARAGGTVPAPPSGNRRDSAPSDPDELPSGG